MAVITSPVTGAPANMFGIGDVYGQIYKDARSIIANADIRSRYDFADITIEEWGAIFASIRFPATDEVGVDKNATSLCGPYYYSTDAYYYNNWVESRYAAEIRRRDLTKILKSELEYSDFLTRVMEANLQGYRADANKSFERSLWQSQAQDTPPTNKALMNFYVGGANISGVVNDATVKGYLQENGRYTVEPGPMNFAQYFAELLARVLDMEFENRGYTESNEDYGASASDLVILMDPAVLAHADIKYLQELYNRDGVNRLPEIRTAPLSIGSYPDQTGGSEAQYYVTFIQDKRLLLHVVRYMEYLQGNIDCRASMYLYLDVEHNVFYLPNYKGWAMVHQLPTVTA